jgi:hypothetical protein
MGKGTDRVVIFFGVGMARSCADIYIHQEGRCKGTQFIFSVDFMFLLDLRLPGQVFHYDVVFVFYLWFYLLSGLVYLTKSHLDSQRVLQCHTDP